MDSFVQCEDSRDKFDTISDIQNSVSNKRALGPSAPWNLRRALWKANVWARKALKKIQDAHWCTAYQKYSSTELIYKHAWKKTFFPCKLCKISLQQGRFKFPSSVGGFPVCISLFLPPNHKFSLQGASHFAFFSRPVHKLLDLGYVLWTCQDLWRPRAQKALWNLCLFETLIQNVWPHQCWWGKLYWVTPPNGMPSRWSSWYEFQN